jgi:Heterokaryon incompatibility protein (HET)
MISLWIDSHCIIQDDADDWKREASKMAEYYQNAVVATDAMTCHEGSTGFVGLQVGSLHRAQALGISLGCSRPGGNSKSENEQRLPRLSQARMAHAKECSVDLASPCFQLKSTRAQSLFLPAHVSTPPLATRRIATRIAIGKLVPRILLLR